MAKNPPEDQGGPAIRDISVLLFQARKITSEKADKHSLRIGDSVSKPVNPPQLPDAISRIFERRSRAKNETMQAWEKGVEAGARRILFA